MRAARDLPLLDDAMQRLQTRRYIFCNAYVYLANGRPGISDLIYPDSFCWSLSILPVSRVLCRHSEKFSARHKQISFLLLFLNSLLRARNGIMAMKYALCFVTIYTYLHIISMASISVLLGALLGRIQRLYLCFHRIDDILQHLIICLLMPWDIFDFIEIITTSLAE